MKSDRRTKLSSPASPSRIARLVFGRGRREVRIRMVVAATGAAVTGVTLALTAAPGLHAPVMEVVRSEVPGLPVDNLAGLVVPILPEPQFEPVEASFAGLEPGRLRQAEDAVRMEVRRGAFPGAALVVGRGSHVVEKKGVGRLAPGMAEVDPDRTLYDLASLTKVVATTTAVMLLVEDGLMQLDAPVSTYLPGFTGGSKPRVTVRHLLTHTSGLPPGIGLPSGSAEATLARLVATPLRWAPGERVAYSDIGPVVLWAAAERAAGEPLDELLRRRVFGPLGMHSTTFRPQSPCTACAPTADTIHGRVHDPIARRLGGIAGNAGLFATATDIGRFAAMLAAGGELEGVRILREETIREFTRRQPQAGTRALGWDTPDLRRASRLTATSFGHTGFTGTSVWIDPARGTWAVLLANRTYTPRQPNRMQALRRVVNERLAEAVDVVMVE